MNLPRANTADYPLASRSASVLSQGDSLVPAFAAARWYPASSPCVQRNLAHFVAGSAIRGRPRPRFGLSMALIMGPQIILDKPSTLLYSVATLNKEAVMEKALFNTLMTAAVSLLVALIVSLPWGAL